MAVSPISVDGIYESEDVALMRDAIEAVCAELGIQSCERDRREAIATRVMHAWMAGGRMPLNLVNAGLESRH